MRVLPERYRPWAVCLGTALSIFVVMGLGVNAFTIFQPGLIAVRGFTNTQVSWITTMRSLFSLLSLMTAEKLCRRLGDRKTMVLGDLMFIGSALLFAMADSFLLNNLAAALSGLGYGYGGMIPLSSILTRWFTAHRGLAIGLATASTGLAAVAMPPILVRLIQGYGLGTAFLGEALIGLALTLLVVLLVRDRPAAPSGTDGEQTNKILVNGQVNGALLAIFSAVFLLGAPSGPGFSHLTVLYQQVGVEPVRTAALISYLGLVLLVGKIFYGFLCDTLGSVPATMLALMCMISGMLLCALASASGLWLAYLAVTLTGLGLPLSSVALSILAGDFSSADTLPRNMKYITSLYMLGSLCFGPLPGMLADFTGSYASAYLVFAGLSAVALVLIHLAYQRRGI